MKNGEMNYFKYCCMNAKCPEYEKSCQTVIVSKKTINHLLYIYPHWYKKTILSAKYLSLNTYAMYYISQSIYYAF